MFLTMEDLTGKRFGSWTVVEFAGKRGNKLLWKCKCDCGTERIILGFTLRNGQSSGCGCTRQYIHLEGQRFGKLLVIKEAGRNAKHEMYWECKCDCGNTYKADGSRLRSGETTDCGCAWKNKDKTGNGKHNLCNTRFWTILHGMRCRCYNYKSPSYKDYGGRGITICDDWQDKEHGLENFRDWAITNGYDESKSIDRIDVNGNYEPSNCRWSTPKQQSSNRRNNVLIDYNGEQVVLQSLADKFGIRGQTIMARLKKGMNIEEALNYSKNE